MGKQIKYVKYKQTELYPECAPADRDMRVLTASLQNNAGVIPQPVLTIKLNNLIVFGGGGGGGGGGEGEKLSC
jgi:hypothetical protein